MATYTVPGRSRCLSILTSLLRSPTKRLRGSGKPSCAEQDGIVGFRHETQVHKAIDLLRGTKSAPELLARLEAISCSLAQLRHFKREGRVNLYASRVLQLRRALLALAEANGEAGAGNRQHTLAASS